MKFDLNIGCVNYFNEICKIPHGSYNEKQLSDYLVQFAKDHSLDYRQDDMGNVVIYKEASAGYENSPSLLLQAHMDMVCEANKSTVFDFEKDSLQLYEEDGWLYAKGTTLGADDGTGVAYMLTILNDDSLPHPKLECVFTVQEEIGLVGALNFDGSWISSKRMVCLDGGGEVKTGISSAGGTIATSTFTGCLIDNKKKTYSLFVSGLSGGHSGGEIHKEKGNANKLAVRIIKEMMLAGNKVNVVKIEGGLKDNAIPRECEIVFACDDDFSKAFEKTVADIRTELEFSDNGFTAQIREVETAEKSFADVCSKKVIDYMFLLPNGFIARSMAIEGLTLTSLNLGIVTTKDDKVIITSSIRSAIESGITGLVDQIKTLAELFGVEVGLSASYPGWNYVPKSELRDKLAKIIKERRNVELLCEAAHGGNECGVFNSYGVEDIITYGPVTEFIHTPDERMDIDSFIRSYDILIELVKECK